MRAVIGTAVRKLVGQIAVNGKFRARKGEFTQLSGIEKRIKMV